MQLFESAKKELLRSNSESNHPFRYFVFATSDSFPEMRTVVSRNIDSDLKIQFYTDSRSPKVRQILSNHKVSLLFYHPIKYLQIRIKGDARTLDETDRDYHNLKAELIQQKMIENYTSMKAPGSNLAPNETLRFGSEMHFSVIEVTPQYLNVLQLGNPIHERRAYLWQMTQWKESRLVP